jgi:type II secretory pathway component GspD/PulD (secretin)
VVSSGVNWSGFNGSGSVAMTGHLAGLLAQNGGQNGGAGSSSSPGLSDQTADNSCQDDASSTGAKEEDDDDEDDDDKLDGLASGDPEKLKAFNVKLISIGHYLAALI